MRISFIYYFILHLILQNFYLNQGKSSFHVDRYLYFALRNRVNPREKAEGRRLPIRRLDGKTRQSFVGQAPACPDYTTHRNSAPDKWLQNGTLHFRKALKSFKKRHLATKKLTEKLIPLHENPQKLKTSQESSQCDNRTPLQIINGIKTAWYFAIGR